MIHTIKQTKIPSGLLDRERDYFSSFGFFLIISLTSASALAICSAVMSLASLGGLSLILRRATVRVWKKVYRSSVTRLSTPLIIGGACESTKLLGLPRNPVCLDIGSGNGELVLMLRNELGTKTYACDYVDGIMRVPKQKVELVDLDREPLPYSDNKFDLITITEVFEKFLKRFLDA